MIGWAFLFELGSPSVHGENAPLYTQLQILVLAGFGIASSLGMIGSVLSKRNARVGGILMLAGAGIGLAALPYVFGNFGSIFALALLPSYGWWAIVLLFGGLFGIRTRAPHQSGRTGSAEGLAASATF